MKSVGPKLKEVRLAARPRMSIRAMGEALHMAASSYAFYESPTTYKKASLPIDFARKVAGVLAERGVDPANVMALAGLNGDEAAPEARAITSKVPPVRFVQMSVALPSENALAEMFEALLLSIGEGHSRAEIARQLAQLLPVGLATLQGGVIDSPSAASPARGAAPPARASADRGPVSRPHI